MIDQDVLDTFIAVTRAESSVEQLADAFEAAIKRLGFDEFAAVSLCHQLGYVPDDAVWIMRYRKEWTDSYFHNDYYKVDPVFRAAREETLPFVWRDYLSDRRLEKAQRRMLAEARELGHLHGMTVPIYVASGFPGCVSLSAERPFDPGAVHTAHLLAIHLFEAARRREARLPTGRAATALTLREQECLKWTAAGKSAWETSRIMNCSEFTVREHLQNVRRKYGVRTTTQAVAHAMMHSELAL